MKLHESRFIAFHGGNDYSNLSQYLFLYGKSFDLPTFFENILLNPNKNTDRESRINTFSMNMFSLT